MDEINWNEAPEGATHWATHEGIERRWHKIEADSLYFFSSLREWIKYGKETSFVAEIRESLVARPVQQEWSGEGFPPVGTVCEYSSLDGTKYYECEILGRNKELVWIRTTECDKHHVKKEADFKFRPIQTEEEKYQGALDNAAHDHCGRIGIGEISVGAFKAGAQWQKERDNNG